MSLSALITLHKGSIIDRWSRKVAERLGLAPSQRPQLVNALPDFLDELAECLGRPPEAWAHGEGAAAHGRHRVEMGLDIGGLAEEFGMVAETVLEVAKAEGLITTLDEATALTRIIARGTAESVRAYARLRDRQLAQEASRHFSFVAHELRTPLNTARLTVHLMSAGGSERSELLARLQRAHDQLADLVDNSLVEARLHGEQAVFPSLRHTHALMREAVSNASMLAARRGVELRIEGDDLPVMVDLKVMTSALTNLVVNGVKFSCQGGVVAIRSRGVDDRVLLEVDDTCGGLPEELPARLFQPFVQASHDRSGFGLGLVIVKQAVEAHGGAVRVVNRPPHGCRFVVELPAVGPEHRDA